MINKWLYFNYLAVSRTFSIQGRASRSEFWFTFLTYLLINFISAFLDALFFPNEIIFSSTSTGELGPLGTLTFFGPLITLFTLQIRRLHDLNAKGWWLLLNIFPIIGNIIILGWFIMKGKNLVELEGEESNFYGPDPLIEIRQKFN